MLLLLPMDADIVIVIVVIVVIVGFVHRYPTMVVLLLLAVPHHAEVKRYRRGH